MSELPENWISTPLGEVCTVVRGITFPTSAKQYQYTPENVCCLRTTNIQKEINWEDVYFISKEYVKRDNQFVKLGDILMSMANSYELVGKVSVVRELPYLSSFGAFLSAVRPLPVIEAQYLFHILRTAKVQSELRKGSSQTVNIANISVSRLSEIDVPLAPLNEQKRIAEKLDSLLARVDSCQTHLERVPQILKRFRQSVLAAAMSGRLTEDWREEKGVNGEWEETDVQSVAFVGTGSTPLRSNSSFYASKGTPWVTSAATGQPFIHEAKEFVTKEAIKVHRLKLFPIGTVIVAMYGEGKTRGQVSELAIEATINQACAAIVVDETKVAKKYLKLALQANYLEMRELAEGGNQPNLNLSKIKEFTFPLPSPKEQAEIVRRVEKLFAYAEHLEARYQPAAERVERLTPSLLAKAFRGELVSQNPNDEPASVLLERIQEAKKTAVAKPRVYVERSKRIEVRMLKRNEIQTNHLSTILLEHGAMTAEALWSASQLEIDEFYDQLKDEEAKDLLHEVRGEDENSPRLLEAL
jgi:type I restriction enzyme S subunit